MPIAAGARRVSAPTTHRLRELERDLEEALRIGRWISDDERAERELERERAQRAHLAQRLRRRKLLALLVVSLLIPPLWPLAIVLTLYILFPLTTVRVAVATGLSLLVLGGVVAVLITALVVVLLMALL